MSQTEKAEYYRELKDAGIRFDKHYREYSTEELFNAVQHLRAERIPSDPQPELPLDIDAPSQKPPTGPPPLRPPPPVRSANPNELPGQRQNTREQFEPIRVDEQGLVWYQEEVRKPAYPRPRGRRVLDYVESGTRIETVKNGEYVESFEVAGDEQRRSAQVKITLPSYQVGIYKDPRFKDFKIHVYNDKRGFDREDVEIYFGGAELVPQEVKKVYVENVLCYDIRTVIRSIQTTYRQLQLAGKV